MKRSDEIYEREEKYYTLLAQCLEVGNLDHFKTLLNDSIYYNIFIDVTKIPRRFELISQLLLGCIERLALGEQINILRFCNENGLIEKELTEDEKKSINEIKKDKLFLANLSDLFGRISDSFISYIYLVFSRDIYEFFINNYTEDSDTWIYGVREFFNHYSIYGLVVRYLGSTKKFIDKFKEKLKSFNNQEIKETLSSDVISENYIEFNLSYRTTYFGDEEEHEYRTIKKHFLSSENILKNLDNIVGQDEYKFYNLSMVVLGGLGPQGLGFTYSTPKGEVVEICSDQKETEAIIIEFKQLQKRKFLGKLVKELVNLDINISIREEIINYLSEIMDPKKLIYYHHKDAIIRKIKNYLNQFDEFQHQNKSDLENLFRGISQAISIILRKIKLKDQFITRMDLVAKDKIKSEDIAKLTSLKGKSHYDVLRERFFFQYIVDWFYQIYLKERRKSKKGY